MESASGRGRTAAGSFRITPFTTGDAQIAMRRPGLAGEMATGGAHFYLDSGGLALLVQPCPDRGFPGDPGADSIRRESHGRRMNAFDIIVVIVLAYSLIRGVFRGLVKEVSSIIGVLGGFFAAYSYYGVLAGYLSGVVANTSYRNILAFLIIFCLVVILVNVAAIVIKYLLKLVFLGWLDRLGGVAFGVAKGVLIVSILFLMLTAFLPKGTPLIKDSACAPYVAMISEKLSTVVSSDIKREFTAKLDELKKAWKNLK
jgi:membrane protein required for colicin V production